jgi:hypothetical protein
MLDLFASFLYTPMDWIGLGGVLLWQIHWNMIKPFFPLENHFVL